MATDFAGTLEPMEALSSWLHRVSSHSLLYQGLKDVLMADPGDDGRPADMSWCANRMRATCGMLLARAQAAGAVSDDLEPLDLLRLMRGVVLSCAYLPEPERTASTDRLLTLVLKGSRAG